MDRHQPHTREILHGPQTGSRDAREILHGPRCSSVMLLADALLQPSSPAPSGPASASGRHPCSTRHRCRLRLPGPPMVRRHPRNSFPSHSDRTCTATRGRHAHTSGRESRGSAGSRRRRRAARRARAARAAAWRGSLAGRRVRGGAREGGGPARGEGRAEFDSRRAYGTLSRNPCTSAAIFPPPLPASRLEGGSTPAGIGARRALGMVAAICGRRGMVGGTAVINQALQGR
jgi:hypothetical protein